MDPADRLRQGMDQLRRSLEETGQHVRRAAEAATSSQGGRRRGGRRNVAVAANVGRDGRVHGVSVTQRSRVRPDGSEEIETTREVYGDDDGKA
jgi:hypothetical protein